MARARSGIVESRAGNPPLPHPVPGFHPYDPGPADDIDRRSGPLACHPGHDRRRRLAAYRGTGSRTAMRGVGQLKRLRSTQVGPERSAAGDPHRRFGAGSRCAPGVARASVPPFP
jgi:hypothetical protein